MLLGKFYYCLNFISIHYVISLWIILYYYFYHIWYILGTLIKGPKNRRCWFLGPILVFSFSFSFSHTHPSLRVYLLRYVLISEQTSIHYTHYLKPTANKPTPNQSQETLPHTGQPPILYKGCTRHTTLPPILDQNHKSQIKITTTIKSPILTIIKLPFTEINKKDRHKTD